MTDAAGHRPSESPAFESRTGVVAARIIRDGSGPEISDRVGRIEPASFPVRGTGAATQAPSAGQRYQSEVHRQVVADAGAQAPSVRGNDRADPQRNRQPRIIGRVETRGRTWLKAAGPFASFSWNIVLIAWWGRNWPRPISFWFRSD